jgi:hypothetical protein
MESRKIPTGATICTHGVEPYTCGICFPPVTNTRDLFIKQLEGIFFCSNGTKECDKEGLNYEVRRLHRAIDAYAQAVTSQLKYERDCMQSRAEAAEADWQQAESDCNELLEAARKIITEMEMVALEGYPRRRGLLEGAIKNLQNKVNKHG